MTGHPALSSDVDLVPHQYDGLVGAVDLPQGTEALNGLAWEHSVVFVNISGKIQSI